MKTMVVLFLCVLLLTGCKPAAEQAPTITYVISGTIVERYANSPYATELLIELSDGIKVPVWDGGKYSDGLKEGDLVRFEVKDTPNGYKVVGIKFTEWGSK